MQRKAFSRVLRPVISPLGLTRSFSSSSAKVGLIGLGNMGGHMAANLIKHLPSSTLFYDINKANVERIQGAKFASIAELSAQSDIIITMLPNTKHVEDVCRNKEGRMV